MSSFLSRLIVVSKYFIKSSASLYVTHRLRFICFGHISVVFDQFGHSLRFCQARIYDISWIWPYVLKVECSRGYDFYLNQNLILLWNLWVTFWEWKSELITYKILYFIIRKRKFYEICFHFCFSKTNDNVLKITG